METSQEQRKLIEKLKKRHKWKSDKKFCEMCPEECAMDPSGLNEHWFCPMIGGQICEICCSSVSITKKRKR